MDSTLKDPIANSNEQGCPVDANLVQHGEHEPPKRPNTIDAVACSIILGRIDLPSDQFASLVILLPVLPTNISCDDIGHIVKSINDDWHRMIVLEILVSRLSTTPNDTQISEILRHFRSSYYRNKASIHLRNLVSNSRIAGNQAGESAG